MRLPIVRLARPLLAVSVVVSASALGVSGLVPEPPRPRVFSTERHVIISPHGVDPGESGTLWLAAESGRTTVLPGRVGETLQHASESLWRDESGRSQVVGLGVRRPGDTEGEPVGLVRLGFPDGRVIDRVATEVFPTAPPCWYPGLRARVLYAGGDGQLYHVDFEPIDASGLAEPPRPRLVRWEGPSPRGDGLYLTSPHWPSDPRFARTVLAGVEKWPDRGRGKRATPRRTWWLRLNAEGDAIEEAGPVFDPGLIAPGVEVRTPSVGVAVDGSLSLAYFTSDDGFRWTLRTAPLEIDAAGHPRVSRKGERLAGDCRPFFPAAFSSDGRWISAVQADRAGRGLIVRLDLADRVSPVSAREVAASGPAGARPVGKWAWLGAIVRALVDLWGIGPTADLADNDV